MSVTPIINYFEVTDGITAYTTNLTSSVVFAPRFRWSVSGASSVVINYGVGSVASSGQDVELVGYLNYPSSIFRITATNAFGTVESTVTIAIASPGTPTTTTTTTSTTTTTTTTLPPLCGPYGIVQVTGQSGSGNLWGFNPYTEDSNIALAAVHAGLITAGQTAYIDRYDADFYNTYPGGTQNGVTSGSFGAYCGHRIRLATPQINYFTASTSQSGPFSTAVTGLGGVPLYFKWETTNATYVLVFGTSGQTLYSNQGTLPADVIAGLDLFGPIAGNATFYLAAYNGSASTFTTISFTVATTTTIPGSIALYPGESFAMDITSVTANETLYYTIEVV